ncbi:MAG TPA: DUF4013 domain-containing protein [Candidatus Dormibacteraeota bacterium]|nr:DUF4013 domain-containing protein [Candidatus Dormibacteraeota bacterium]HEX2681794.1 DUF4013 domain-containing protein [Candidatus Dormibacteraeota bacterium]
MQVVADSFAWPFRGEWRRAWLPGLACVLLLPFLFIPLLGYAIEAVRAGQAGPPPWRLSRRLFSDGFLTSVVVVISVLPFAVAWFFVDGSPVVCVAAFFLLALPWGLLVLLLVPHATARFALTGRPADLFDFAASLRSVRHDFARWNTVAAAMVTGWAVGLACVGLLCVGLVPGVFYAILVSAHAASTLQAEDQRPLTR